MDHSTLKVMVWAMNSITDVSATTWDRCTQSNTHVSAFGWIARMDGLRDFVVVHCYDGIGMWFTTSSAKWSRTLSERLGDGSPHRPCQRIAEVFDDCVIYQIALSTEEGNDGDD